MANFTLKPNEKAVAQLLKSARIRADVEARARRIAAAAGGEPDFVVRGGTTDRAHAVVITATHKARRAEAENRALTRAIGAGR